jgi:hypothetical protein
MASDFGPQRGPASDGRLRAQQRQLQKQLEEDAIQAANRSPDDDRWCRHCNYAIYEVPTTSGVMRFCSKCLRSA